MQRMTNHSLIPFLFLFNSMQLVLLARLPTSSSNSSSSSATLSPRVVAELRYAIEYAIGVVTGVADLLQWSLAAIGRLPTPGEIITAKGFVARTLHEGVGSVVVPLLTGIWCVQVDVVTASKLVPPLYQLLKQTDALVSFNCAQYDANEFFFTSCL